MLKVLRLAQAEGTVAIGLSLESPKVQRKDLIKIENRELTQDEVNKIALISPAATLSIIRDFKVVKKFKPELPDRLEGLLQCKNPSCISNAEKIPTHFTVLNREQLRIRCDYCERAVSKAEIDLL